MADKKVLIKDEGLIRSFKSKNADKIFYGFYVRKFDRGFQLKIRQKLNELDSATQVCDLRVPRNNHLEKLSGDLKGYWSISIKRGDNKYGGDRVLFKWKNNAPYDVMIIDYHK